MILVLVMIGVLLISQNELVSINDSNEYRITNVKIYDDTPAKELASVVKNQNVSKIEQLVIDSPELINYQDPKYGATLLMWAIGMEKYESAESLLKLGADPDISMKENEETPLFLATRYSWVDNNTNQDPRFVELLLRYNADPNKSFLVSKSEEERSIIESGTSPLMHSIGRGIEKTKLLVEAGADINHKSKSGRTAATTALEYAEDPYYAYYLIALKKAKITEPHYSMMILPDDDPNKEFLPVTKLRKWEFDLDSDEFKLKMEIVKEFTRQGVDYWETPIRLRILEQIKILYPNDWEEYIKNIK